MAYVIFTFIHTNNKIVLYEYLVWVRNIKLHNLGNRYINIYSMPDHYHLTNSKLRKAEK